MMRNRLYTKDEVLQVVEAALNALDSTEAPIQEPEHLDNEPLNGVDILTRKGKGRKLSGTARTRRTTSSVGFRSSATG